MHASADTYKVLDVTLQVPGDTNLHECLQWDRGNFANIFSLVERCGLYLNSPHKQSMRLVSRLASEIDRRMVKAGFGARK